MPRTARPETEPETGESPSRPSGKGTERGDPQGATGRGQGGVSAGTSGLGLRVQPGLSEQVPWYQDGEGSEPEPRGGPAGREADPRAVAHKGGCTTVAQP